MKEKTKRLHILLSEQEHLAMQQEAQSRGISIAELLRDSFRNQTTGLTAYDRFLSLQKLVEILPVDK